MLKINSECLNAKPAGLLEHAGNKPAETSEEEMAKLLEAAIEAVGELVTA